MPQRALLDARCGMRLRLVDVGCGAGDLFRVLSERLASYVGVDLVRYQEFPGDDRAEFVGVDLNAPIPLPEARADAVVSIETIEHLENPRALFRELVRLVRPGGLVLVTTPNQLSLLSKLTLLVKNQFNAFQDVQYPAHITALVETDLRRIMAECNLEKVEVTFTGSGRIPGTARPWPRMLSGRWFSDNIVLSGLKRGT